MSATLAALRSKMELALAGRVTAPFSYRDRKIVETVATGISEIDCTLGGFPRGSLTEICGPACSGRTTLLISALAARTGHAEFCALVDGCNSFDPQTAAAAGVDLKKLLWVRCRGIDQALQAADLLLQGGGFSFIALDLSDIPCEMLRQVPLNAWFRFRRVIEDTPTVFVVLAQESNAKTCASLVLQMSQSAARWMRARPEQSGETRALPCACLFDGLQVAADTLCTRFQSKDNLLRVSPDDFAGKPGGLGIQTKTICTENLEIIPQPG
jgi:recombination protein RecA